MILMCAHHVSKMSCYLILYNLKKPEPVFVIFGRQYPDNPSF